MKDWLSIGQFSKKAGVSPRTLRIYEEMGLLLSHVRGTNGYRYYRLEQLEFFNRIKQFKGLGFSLSEIKSLLQMDQSMDSEKLINFLNQRWREILEQQQDLDKQKIQVENILTSLNKANTGLCPSERRFVMSHFEKLSIVVTGVKDLELTARHIQEHLGNAGQGIEVHIWDGIAEAPERKPSILVIPEKLLFSEKAKAILPDVVVIKNISQFNSEIQNAYLNLYKAAGPHMTTVFNADDRISVELAANTEIRKGRTFYYSKNAGLEDQIKAIGGVVSDGEQVKIFGFNLNKTPMNFKLDRILGFDEETALLASLTAVMDVGLDRAKFQSTIF